MRRRMSQRKHRERIDAHMTSKKMLTSESEYRGNGHENVSVENDKTPNEEIKAPISMDYSPKTKIYDRSWNVPASEIRNYRNFLKQYIAKNAGGEGFEPFSERGLTTWGINARDSTFELLRKVLLGEIHPTTVDQSNGVNALHLACLSGSTKAVEKVLSIGVINPLNPTKDKAGTMQSIHFTFRNYADNPNIINPILRKYLPFIRKSRKDVKNNGDAAVVALSICDRDGRNSLHLSSLYSNKKMLQEAIKISRSAPSQAKAHAFFHSVDKRGRTALHYAMFRSDLEIVKICINDLNLMISTTDRMLRNALHYVAMGTKKKYEEQAKLLQYIYSIMSPSQRKGSLDAKSIAGFTPFACACKHGNSSVMAFFLNDLSEEDAIDVDQKDLEGIPPIFHCMNAKFSKNNKEGSVLDRIKMILPFYKSIEDIYGGPDKSSLLMHACYLELDCVVEYLLRERPNEVSIHDTRESDKYTALHICAKFGGIPCTEILLRNGASLLKQDQDGCTPFRLAVGSNQLDIVNLFLSHMFSNESETTFPLSLTALEQSYVLETPCKQGLTPFLVAMSLENLEMAKLLHCYGCNIHAKSNIGNNALHIAAAAGKGNTVAFLDELGVAQEFFRETNKKKIKPFEVATKWENKSVKSEIYKLFVDREEGDGRIQKNTSLRTSRSTASNSSRSSTRSNLRVEQRPLTPFARSYSQKTIKAINEKGNAMRRAAIERKKKQRLKQKMIEMEPKRKKKFSFDVMKLPN